MKPDKLNITALALAVAMGGFLLGFDATVISGAGPFVRQYFGLEGEYGSLQYGWAVSSLGWGAMAGNLCAGLLSDRFGRRAVLRLTALLFLASALLAAFSSSFTMFVIARISSGLAVGAAILTAPVYIAEIAPGRPTRRPRLAEPADDRHRHFRLVLFEFFPARHGRRQLALDAGRAGSAGIAVPAAAADGAGEPALAVRQGKGAAGAGYPRLVARWRGGAGRTRADPCQSRYRSPASLAARLRGVFGSSPPVRVVVCDRHRVFPADHRASMRSSTTCRRSSRKPAAASHRRSLNRSSSDSSTSA